MAALMAPASGQLLDRTDAQREIEIGRQTAVEVERQLPVSRDATMQARVRRIGSALIAAMPTRAYPYQFKVLDIRDFNAFCLPGGFMYVFEGLLNRLESDDAVAFVMAHEITHASHRHWKRMVEKMRGPALIATLAGAALGADDVAALAATLVQSQYSREQEDDADEGGIGLAAAAGFDPAGAVTAASEMAKLDSGDLTPIYLRSHPPAKDRRSRLAKAAETLAQAARSAQARGALHETRSDLLTPILASLPSGSGTPTPWWPMAVGNLWTYTVTSAGNRTEHTIRVASKADGPKGTAWRVGVSFPGMEPVTAYLATTQSEVWRRDRPFRAGSAWTLDWRFASVPSGPVGSEDHELPGREDVTTPCGAFTDCLKVRRRADGAVVEAWFAAGVGMVKRVTRPVAGETPALRSSEVTEILTAYRLASATEGR